MAVNVPEEASRQSAPFDLFWDLSGSIVDPRGVADQVESFGADEVGAGVRVVAALPNGLAETLAITAHLSVPDGNPGDALWAALRRAAADNRGLAVVTGAWLPSPKALKALADLVSADPLLGSAQPRFAQPDTDLVWPLPGAPESNDALRLDALARLPHVAVTPEFLSACLLLSPSAVTAADRPSSGPSQPALASLLTAARRRGFRNVVGNRVVVNCPLPSTDVYPKPSELNPDADAAADLDRAHSWLASSQQSRLEIIFRGAYEDGRSRVLLDCRQMHATHNGTAHAILGLLEGFNATGRTDLDLHVVAGNAAVEFHGLVDRYRSLNIHGDEAPGSYLAAIHLTQPWSLRTFFDLHDLAWLNFFYIYDTIAWDIIYAAPDGLDAVWRFAATWSDGLLFDSEFTRDRFAFRFPMPSTMKTTVTYLSLAAADSVVNAKMDASRGRYILVMGNPYDHKDLQRTTRLLNEAFPTTPIVVLGAATPSAGMVTSYASGSIDPVMLGELVVSASVIVYPSFYEGFGLPVTLGLANGRPVVARSSALWVEIAEHTRMPGALVMFRDTPDLVDAVGRALHGLPPRALAQGGSLAAGEEPASWSDCSARILALVDELVAHRDAGGWIARDTALAAHRALNDDGH